MYNFHRIPAELRILVQWICWRYEVRNENEKPTKVPYNPATGHPAKVNDPATWVSFEQAVSAYTAGIGYDGIGFVFTANDPYCGVDFDETDPAFPEDLARQIAMHNHLNSYSEYSPSGKGIHAIVKASIPHGRKRSNIEIYSSERYFTFTGNVFNDAPIVDRQKEIDFIWAQMGVSAQPVYYAGDLNQVHEDEEIWQRAANAQNGDLFVRLWNGDWTGYRPNASGTASSEADFALIDIIAYYTRNRMQIQRMFLASALGKRDKYKRLSLIGYMINKSFDNMLPEVDLSAVTDKVNAALAGQRAQQAEPSAPANAVHSVASVAQPAGVASVVPGALPAPSLSTMEAPGADPYTWNGFRLDTWRNTPPPGLMGAVGQWIYEQSPRPVYEIALAGALGFMAGLCGRAFNVSNSGLNLYVMLLASTGTGKEAMASGVDRLLAAVKKKVPAAANIQGPGEIVSGQALLKYMAAVDMPCFVSIVGEFGIKLKQITGNFANSADATLLRVMLDLYHKSGKGQSVKPSIYSDKKNNTEEVHSPAFTLLGETVPSTFFEALDESAISSGLLPRFLNIEYEGPRVPLSKTHHLAVPPEYLVAQIDELFMAIHNRMQNGEVIDVIPDRDAAEQLAFLDEYADSRINAAQQDVIKQIWNRFHMKVMRVAALIAVGCNPYLPTINRAMVDWASSLVLNDILKLIARFERGEIGAHRNVARTQEAEIKNVWRDYVSTPIYSFAVSYKINAKMHADRVITKSYLYQRCKNKAPFRGNYLSSGKGSIQEFDAQIRNLISMGIIQQLPKQQASQNYGEASECFAILDANWLISDD